MYPGEPDVDWDESQKQPRLDRVVKLTQIATGNFIDQAGRHRMILYGLDASGALWADDGEGLGWCRWRRVEQPADFDGNQPTNWTRGVKRK